MKLQHQLINKQYDLIKFKNITRFLDYECSPIDYDKNNIDAKTDIIYKIIEKIKVEKIIDRIGLFKNKMQHFLIFQEYKTYLSIIKKILLNKNKINIKSINLIFNDLNKMIEYLNIISSDYNNNNIHIRKKEWIKLKDKFASILINFIKLENKNESKILNNHLLILSMGTIYMYKKKYTMNKIKLKYNNNIHKINYKNKNMLYNKKFYISKKINLIENIKNIDTIYNKDKVIKNKKKDKINSYSKKEFKNKRKKILLKSYNNNRKNNITKENLDKLIKKEINITEYKNKLKNYHIL